MLQQEKIEEIRHYLDGVADNRELASVEALFSQGHQNRELRSWLEQDWVNPLPDPDPRDADLLRILDRVHHLIREREERLLKSWAHRLVNSYTRLAAILFFPLLLLGGWYLYRQNHSPEIAGQMVRSVIHAPLGSRVSFNLPDGTTGWLNSGSSLTYSLPFNDQRQVSLEGEAWFDVAHDLQHPFEVSVGEARIDVLGTSFDVSGYREEGLVEVVLLNGKVEFTGYPEGPKTLLTPSQRLVYRDGQAVVEAVEAAKYQAWTDGKLVFRGDNMVEVARRLERWYNIEMEIADRELNNFSFRGTFEDDSLQETLRLLSLTSPMGYRIVQREQQPDGSYQKVKVILFSKMKSSKNK